MLRGNCKKAAIKDWVALQQEDSVVASNVDVDVDVDALCGSYHTVPSADYGFCVCFIGGAGNC